MIKIILISIPILVSVFLFYYSLAIASAPITDEERILEDEAQIEYINRYIREKKK